MEFVSVLVWFVEVRVDVAFPNSSICNIQNIEHVRHEPDKRNALEGTTRTNNLNK